MMKYFVHGHTVSKWVEPEFDPVFLNEKPMFFAFLGIQNTLNWNKYTTLFL